MRWYPGSPVIALHLLREQDRIILMELHNNEIEILRKIMRGDKRVEIHHRDGFEGLIGILPPEPARGLVLIDPAYEVKEDYKQVVGCLQEAYRRWPTGIYAVWYPLLSSQSDKSSTILQQLARSDFKNLLVAEMSVCEQRQDFGMHGSGMAVINAPWKLDLQLRELLPRVTKVLAQDNTARWKVAWKINPE
jgi:23S rRNA (adenine2030-N6)-methyltransferase